MSRLDKCHQVQRLFEVTIQHFMRIIATQHRTIRQNKMSFQGTKATKYRRPIYVTTIHAVIELQNVNFYQVR